MLQEGDTHMNIAAKLRSLLVMAAALLLCSACAQVRTGTGEFTFVHEGRRYSGLVDVPAEKPATAMVVIVPGSGKTDIVAGNWFRGLRQRLTGVGVTCLVWDKAGCGMSEGVFEGD